MKRTLKNNKGFSLVELIVVVLIMAIIAVALAPQIMKWVGHSRTSTDANTYDTLYENVQLVLANEGFNNAAKNLADSAAYIIKMDENGTTVSGGTGAPTNYTAADFQNKLAEVSGSKVDATYGLKDIKRKDGTGSYEIKVYGKDGAVKVEKVSTPAADNVKS